MLLFLALLDVGGLALGWSLLRRRERGPGPSVGGDLAVLALTGVAVAALGAAGAWLLFGNGFAILRAWTHALACVLAPLCMLRGALLVARRRSPFAGALLVFLGATVDATFVYARHVAPFALEVSRPRVASARLGVLERPIRIALLADLQTDAIGAWERDVFARLDAEAPDLILISGDMLQVEGAEAFAAERDLLRELLFGLRPPPLGIFAVGGDIDAPKDLLYGGTGVRYLRNELVELAPRLRLLGLTASASRRPLAPEHLAAARTFDGLSIVLGHAPDFAAALLDGSGPPLVCVAGHTHGGQVVIPGFGPPLTLSSLPRRYASGLHRLGDAWLLVSRGVGMERAEAPRVRLFCPPELPVLELSGSDPP